MPVLIDHLEIYPCERCGGFDRVRRLFDSVEGVNRYYCRDCVSHPTHDRRHTAHYFAYCARHDCIGESLWEGRCDVYFEHANSGSYICEACYNDKKNKFYIKKSDIYIGRTNKRAVFASIIGTLRRSYASNN